MSTTSRTGKRASQKRSKTSSGALAYENRFRLGDGPGVGRLVAAGLGLAAGAVAAGGAPAALRLVGKVKLPGIRLPAIVFPSDGPIHAGLDPACPAEAATGGLTASVPAAPEGAAPGSRFASPVSHAPGVVPGLRPGAVRDFLRARFPMQKAHLTVAALTGVPAGTIRNAMAWNGPSELSGAHMLRLVAAFGPDFVAAVMDPPPAWVMEGGR